MLSDESGIMGMQFQRHMVYIDLTRLATYIFRLLHAMITFDGSARFITIASEKRTSCPGICHRPYAHGELRRAGIESFLRLTDVLPASRLQTHKMTLTFIMIKAQSRGARLLRIFASKRHDRALPGVTPLFDKGLTACKMLLAVAYSWASTHALSSLKSFLHRIRYYERVKWELLLFIYASPLNRPFWGSASRFLFDYIILCTEFSILESDLQRAHMMSIMMLLTF